MGTVEFLAKIWLAVSDERPLWYRVVVSPVLLLLVLVGVPMILVGATAIVMLIYVYDLRKPVFSWLATRKKALLK
jgi:hypothetical protein